MKNDNIQEHSPVYSQEAGYRSDDEISLTDLALVLIHRKTMIITIVILFIAAAVAYALTTPKIYTYSTTIEIGSQVIDGSIKPFESAHALLAKVKYNFIPLVISQHKQSFPEDKTIYKIKSSVPGGSNITLLELNGTEESSDTYKKLLEAISQKAIYDHSRIYRALKSSLETRLKQRTVDLKFLKNSNNNETEVVTNRVNIEALSTQLANLRKTKQIQSPIRSVESTNARKTLIVTIFAFSGIFLGVVAAFITEFVVKVKEEKNKVTR